MTNIAFSVTRPLPAPLVYNVTVFKSWRRGLATCFGLYIRPSTELTRINDTENLRRN